jgi:hypothetical protein
MKKMLLLILGFLCSVGVMTALAWQQVTYFAPSDTPTTICDGWPAEADGNCTPIGVPVTESVTISDRTYTNIRVHSGVDKTAISITAYMTTPAVDDLYVRLYRQDEGEGNFVLIGHAVVTQIEDTWVETNLSAFGAENLIVDAGDVLAYGVGIETVGGSVGLGRNDETGSLWYSTADVNATAPNPVTLVEITGRKMGLILKLQ